MEEGTKKNLVDWIIPVICLVLALATVAIVYYLHPGDKPLERLTLVVAYVIVILVFFFGLMVLIAMATNKIDISGLLCEPTENKASMSRFQLLIFIFVIAFSLVLIILSNDPIKFPDVPSGILLLLGISASTYAVSKGMSSGAAGGTDATTDETTSTTTDPATGKTTTTVHDHATGQSTTRVHEPATGQTTTTVHNPTTVTTTTSVSPPKPTV
jgi:hypothetical protein